MYIICMLAKLFIFYTGNLVTSFTSVKNLFRKRGYKVTAALQSY